MRGCNSVTFCVFVMDSFSVLYALCTALNFGCTNPSPVGDKKLREFVLVSTQPGHLVKRAAATAS
nr:MAG TPA: hypothetical protein [Caudoviricetes sp.]